MATMQTHTLTVRGRNAFDCRVRDAAGEDLTGHSIETVQANIGLAATWRVTTATSSPRPAATRR